MRLLSFPLPIFASIMFPQWDPSIMKGAPGWLSAFLVGIWVAVSIAEKFGKLPGGGNNRRKESFTSTDRGVMNNLNELLSSSDDSGIPRFLLMNQRHKELCELTEKLLHLQEQQTTHLQVISEAMQRSA